MALTGDEHSVTAATLLRRADDLSARREWAAANECFQKVLQLDDSARHRISYGCCLAEQERFHEAIIVMTPVLDGQDRDAIGIVCHNLAAIYREVGDYDLARRFQWRATLLNESIDADGLLGMANDALADQFADAAGSLILTASELKAEQDRASNDADLLATAGLAEAETESPQAGLMTLFTAYRWHRDEGDLKGMGTDQLNMSVLFGKLNRHRAERACLVRAIRLFDQAAAPFSSTKARSELKRLDNMQAVRSFNPERN